MKLQALIPTLLPTLLPALLCGAELSSKPNVIIMYIDDMGYGDIGCNGGDFAPTPNIDRLAEQGISFDQYYSAAPVSSASRCGLITGEFPLEHGINTFLATKKYNKLCEQRDYLDADAPSMARAFQQSGYSTALIGKWHLGGGRDVDDAPPITAYGFDEYLSTYESPNPDPLITATDWIWSKQDSIKRWRRTEYFVDKSIEFIERKHKNDRPFFLYFCPDDVHTPWVPESYCGSKKTEFVKQPPFELVLAELDKQIGRMMAALDELNIADNTIVIFTSDNGASPTFKTTRTAQLRGEKNSLYEGGIRMPFIIRYPNEIEAGQRNKTSIVSAVDLYPSLCAIAGIDTEQDYNGDGESMKSTLLGSKAQIRKGNLMWDFGRNKHFNAPKDPYHKSPHLAIRRGKWKLLINSDGSDVQLYDMKRDKYETTNLADSHKRLVAKLSKKVRGWYTANK